MARSHEVTINGQSFVAHHGEVLLDAALSNGIDLPYDCRAGHCGTCCVRLVSGEVRGGEGSEPGIVHACQCRIVDDAVLEQDQPSGVRSVEGVVRSLRPLSPEVMEVGIKTNRPLPYHAGQYVQVRFSGYPSRPYSITHPLHGNPNSRLVWFHIRRVKHGRVSSSLGKRIRPGHRVTLTGPHGSAHFRPNLDSRLILIATNTGFAPIWSIAVAALREDPERMMMIIAGGRTMESLYMIPALVQLARFPNVHVVPVCSTRQGLSKAVKPGRPTDYLPGLLPSDVLYACGAPEMVDSIKSIAANVGAVCYADPFLPTADDPVEQSVLTRAMGWLAVPTKRQIRELAAATRRQMRQLALDRPRNRREQPMQAHSRLRPEPLMDLPRKRREQPMQAHSRLEPEPLMDLPRKRRREQPMQAHSRLEPEPLMDLPRKRREQPAQAPWMAEARMQAYKMAEARVRSHYRS